MQRNCKYYQTETVLKDAQVLDLLHKDLKSAIFL